MPSAQTQTRTPGGKRGNARGRGGNSNHRRPAKNVNGITNAAAASDSHTANEGTSGLVEKEPEGKEDEEAAVCWICAEPVKYYSVSECNHRTCHVCALRLRALYKKNDCTFCKAPQPSVIFTTSADTPFSSFTAESIPHKDAKLSVFFETQEMMEETLILLRFNCPDPDCEYIGSGWGDLKLHVRAMHGKMLCELCLRFKKVFAHEHALYAASQLPVHLPSLPHRSRNLNVVPKEQIEGGIHPLCEFCRECFFSEDELFGHMRERHEECFICKRNNVRDQYFQNYDSLENHFTRSHHPCTQPQCLTRKFVVFNSALDLKAHMVEEHAGDMTTRDKKDARKIQAEFEFEDVGSRRGRRDREREPLPQEPPRLAGPSARLGGRRRERFGANLTEDGGQGSSEPSRRPTPSPPPPAADVDPIVAQRHAAFIARLRSLAPNPITAVPAVKAAIHGYRASESSARDLILTIWNIVDQGLDDAASIVNAFVDILDEDDKKKDMLNAWNGFKIEQRRQFPDLVPTAMGSDYAGITNGRVLNAKHSTGSRSSQQSTRQVLDRVAQAAGSSSNAATAPAPAPRPPERFPPLQTQATPAHRHPQRHTPWAATTVRGHGPLSVPTPQSDSRNSSPVPAAVPPKLTSASFPQLPSSGNTRSKASVSGNTSLRKILGDSGPVASAWQPGRGVSGELEGGDEVSTSSGKGKRGKGKQKQTLFTLGSFPT